MIDHTRLEAMAHGSASVQAGILADFRRMNSLDVESLRAAIGRDDFAGISILAHRIKGAGMMIGAVQFAETCSLVSMAGRAADRKAVIAALVFLEREMTQLDEYLDTLERLPSAPAPLAASPTAQDVALLCSGLTFLVVEDHPFQRDLIMRFLRRLGAAEVRGFAEGAAALEALDKQAADIMVLDLSMPGVDGMDLMRMMCGAGHSISIILNSALSPSLMASLIRMAKSYSVDMLGAVSKPLTVGSLGPLIDKYRAGRIAAAPETGNNQ